MTHSTTTVRPQTWRAVISSSLGNALEWLDVIIYRTFAVTIAKLYFPNNDPTVTLLITFGTFGVTFFMRPLGAVVQGSYADRVGRKSALTLSILLMMVGTLIIAVMPNYQAIGIWTPIGIVVARLLQGFSAGCEFGSATAFLVEHAPNRRGFSPVGKSPVKVPPCCWLPCLAHCSIHFSRKSSFLAGAGVSRLMIEPAGYYIGHNLQESPEFIEAGGGNSPLKEIFSYQKERLLIATGCVITATIGVYTILYIPTYAVKQLHMSSENAFGALVSAGIMQIFLSPFIGHYSDKIGRTPFMIFSSVMIFGGFAGMTITWLIAVSGNSLAIFFYVIGGATISMIATLAARFRLNVK